MEKQLKLSNIIENIDLFEQRIKSSDTFYEKYIVYIAKIKFLNDLNFNLSEFIKNLLSDFNQLYVYFDYNESDLILIKESIKAESEKIFCSLYEKLKHQKYKSKIKNNTKLVFNFSQELILLDKKNNTKLYSYRVNDIECCRVKYFKEYFCPVDKKTGRIIPTRSVLKDAKSTSWNKIGIEKVLGPNTYNKEYFKDSAPNTKWGDTGVAISFNLFKEIFNDYIKKLKL